MEFSGLFFAWLFLVWIFVVRHQKYSCELISRNLDPPARSTGDVGAVASRRVREARQWRDEILASAAVAGWTERASAFLALVSDNLLFVGCRVPENRRDGNHRDTAITAHRRRKFDCSVFDRINTHHKPHALYTFIYLTRSLRPSFPVAPPRTQYTQARPQLTTNAPARRDLFERPR